MKDFAKSIHVGNANKAGNAGGNLDAAAARDIREMAAKYWHSGIHDTRQLATTVAWEWAKKSKTVRDTTQDLVSEVKDIIDRSLNEIKTGNKKVGNADILSGNYIILADNGEVWFRDEHENVHIRNIDSWAQKRIASYQSSIDEIKKGVAEAKQAAKKAGMI